MCGVAGAALLVASGCSTSEDSAEEPKVTDAAAETTTSVAPPPPFVILLTNDDGIAAPGIDVMAQALSGLSGVELVISAPAENQSGTADKTTDGAVESAAAKTSSGIEGTAVKGFPADSVKAALDAGLKPTLVVSGINAGQNIGPLSALSGTVGAAKTAARAGYPAVAVSQGLGPEPDYPAAAQLVMDWIAEHREELLDGTAPVAVVSYNVPSCDPTSALKELVEVPLATDAKGRDMLSSNCASTATAPADDVDAFINGYPSVAEVAFN
jgi:5'-nucleotidase